MSLYPVSLVIFYEKKTEDILNVWTQIRTDDGPFHGLLEFPGGGVEPGEAPVQAAIREVQEEVGVELSESHLTFMGIYSNPLKNKNILLYVFLSNHIVDLQGKGEWLQISSDRLSLEYEGRIPGPNHKIIDDLYYSLGKIKNE